MKKINTLFIGLIIATITMALLGSIVAKVSVSDKVNVTSEEKILVHSFLYQHLENPISRAFISDWAIERRSGEIFYVGVYSLFGIKCLEVELVLESRAKTIYMNEACHSPIQTSFNYIRSQLTAEKPNH